MLYVIFALTALNTLTNFALASFVLTPLIQASRARKRLKSLLGGMQ